MGVEDLYVTVLRPLQVQVGGQPVGPVAEALKPNLLLAVLAVNANRALSKDELVEALWTDPPPSSRNLVEKYVSIWRKAVGPHRLATVGSRYRLDLAPDECDLLASERDAAEGRAAVTTGELRAAAGALSRAIDRWPEDMADTALTALPPPTLQRLSELYLSTLEAWATVLLRLGESDHHVLGRLAAAQLGDPMRERLCELRTWTLFQHGRQAEALMCFETLRREMQDQLGQQPSPALQAMQLRVLRQDTELLGPQHARPTAITNLPRRNRHFVGRDAELGQVEQRLQRLANGSGPTALAIWGLVGAGKSAVLLEYAHRHLGEFDCVWWMDGATQVSLAAGVEALAHRLGCELPADRAQGLDALWAALERRRWLLVIDNASTIECVGAFWPRVANGIVLLSSLNPEWHRLADTMVVDVMTIDDSVKLLESRHHPVNEWAETLAKALGCLPLALSQAAAYIEQTGMSAEQYLAMFLRRRSQLLQRGIPDDHAGTIEATWRLASAELHAEDPAAVQLLSFGAFLAPEHIPFDLVRCAPEILPEELRAAVVDEIGLEDAIGHARRYSLLRRDGDEFAMHFLLQEVISASLPTAEQHEWRQRLCRLVSAFAPASVDSRADWPRWESLGPHVLVLAADCVSVGSADPEFVALLRRMSAYLLMRASFVDAQTLSRAALALSESGVETSDHDLIGQILTELGTVLEQSGNHREALAAQERAVGLLQHSRGPDDPWMARALSGLGSVLTCHLGVTLWRPDELDQAERRLVHALDVLRTAFGARDPMVARTMAALGQVVQDRGALADGQKYFEDAIGILEAAYGPDHPETTRTNSKLAFVLGLRGDHERSIELQARTVEKLELTFGVEDLEIAWPLSNLAVAYLAAGRLEEAGKTQQRAHDIFLAVSPGGAAAQITAWRMAKVDLAMGHPADALARLQPALAALRQVMDADYRDVIEMERDVSLALAGLAAAPIPTSDAGNAVA